MSQRNGPLRGRERRTLRTKGECAQRYRGIRIWRSRRYVTGQRPEGAKLKMQTEAGLEVASDATLNFGPIDNGCQKTPRFLQLEKTPAPASISPHKRASGALKNARGYQSHDGLGE